MVLRGARAHPRLGPEGLKQLWTVAAGVPGAHPSCERRRSSSQQPASFSWDPGEGQGSERLSGAVQGRIPISWEGPLRLRQKQLHAQGHRASRTRSKNSNPGLSHSTPAVFTQAAGGPQRAACVGHITSALCHPAPPPGRAAEPCRSGPIRSEGADVDRSSYFTKRDRPSSSRKNLISPQHALVQDDIRAACNPVRL